MPSKYLDLSGLSYLWGKMKLFIDSLYLKLTGGTLTGTLFISKQSLSISSPALRISGPNLSYALQIQRTDVVKGVLPDDSSAKYWMLGCYGAALSSADDRIGQFRVALRSSGSEAAMIAYDCRAGKTSADAAALYVRIDPSGVASAYGPSTPAGSSGAQLATANFVLARQSECLMLSGNQISTGQKEFASPLVVNRPPDTSYSNVALRATHSKGALPDASSIGSIFLYDKNGLGVANRIGGLMVNVNTSGTHSASLVLYRNEAGNQTSASLSMTYVTGATAAADSVYMTVPSTRPNADNACWLGTASRRWTEVFAATSAINTSDERLKTDISSVPGDVLDAWDGVAWVFYRMRDAVERKGAGARVHGGLIAQRARDAFAVAGLDASRYGFFCHDAWDASDWESPEGETVHEAAGDRYSLRYAEALSIEAAYMRRENARLKERVAALEDRLAALELRLGSE